MKLRMRRHERRGLLQRFDAARVLSHLRQRHAHEVPGIVILRIQGDCLLAENERVPEFPLFQAGEALSQKPHPLTVGAGLRHWACP
jgi:hypothetical protein